MRVIAGSARSIPLVTPEGVGTRPTTDRIKETLFNILMDELYEARVLDLFAGSGQLAIEALSRGASRAVIVDSGKKPIECIKANIKKTRFEDKCTILQKEIPFVLGSLGSEKPFDLIFMDPPYENESLVSDSLDAIAAGDLLSEYGLIVVETALGREITPPKPFTVSRIKTYKTNQHVFIRRNDA